ncbi:hypothetical protein N7466_003522 [Penicillium verhagenii]|uniref:uncharacterized protein n=1 Tax=Penicillium verhagenii TaxID=1562060 RepID=UPI0025458889|nr:uncharacterized protein N7466_003522 [Penicillium verhagenii]KAJ5937072.1 hypothetical protein N7466_003522 [Penicillium verhagenii]
MNPVRFQEQSDLKPAMTPFSSTIPDVTPAWMQTAHPTTGDVLSKETIRAIVMTGPEEGKALFRMWQESADPATVVPIILQRALLVLEERLQNLETALDRTGNLMLQREQAFNANKHLLKHMEPITTYSGKIKDRAAHEFIRDCERYFGDLETFSGEKISERSKITVAINKLTGHAGRCWGSFEHGVTANHSSPITTFQEFKE